MNIYNRSRYLNPIFNRETIFLCLFPDPSPIHSPLFIILFHLLLGNSPRKREKFPIKDPDDKGAAEGNENALCVYRGHVRIVYSSPSIVKTRWMARDREKKKGRNQAQTRKNHPVGLVTRARKTRGGRVERRSSKYRRGKNGNNGLAIARDHPCDVGCTFSRDIRSFPPHGYADYYPLRVASVNTQLRIWKSERRI